jgi:hypothetical protein
MVAGAAALCLEKYPASSPATVVQTILSQATLDTVGSVGTDTPNRLLFTLFDTSDQTTGDSQLLPDPSFEFGTTFWVADLCTVIKQIGCPPDLLDVFDIFGTTSVPSHRGTSHATFGGAVRSFNLSSGTVTIPSTVRKAELSFYLWIVTKEKDKKKNSSARDTFTVEIRDASGKLLETVATYSNVDANETYTLRRFDVSRYIGKTIRIGFVGNQKDAGKPTYFMLDDVALNVWR